MRGNHGDNPIAHQRLWPLAHRPHRTTPYRLAPHPPDPLPLFVREQTRPAGVLPQDAADALPIQVVPTVSQEVAGAGEGNRTLVCSLGSCRSAIELRPQSTVALSRMTFGNTGSRLSRSRSSLISRDRAISQAGSSGFPCFAIYRAMPGSLTLVARVASIPTPLTPSQDFRCARL